MLRRVVGRCVTIGFPTAWTASAPSYTAAVEDPVPPRTQRERSQHTREQVLEATVACLAEHGYAATTTLKIQELAGVSRGRLLHQYPSRDALLIDAVQYIAAKRYRLIAGRADHLAGPDRIEGAIRMLWSSFDGTLFWAALELWLAARSNTALQSALAPAERRLGQVIRDLADLLFGWEHTRHQLYPLIRDQLVESMRGVALTYAIEPRMPETDPHLKRWVALARTCLETTPSDSMSAG
jgi:AcrR family transcriptional regulator